MPWNLSDEAPRPSSVAIVTGANSGIGYETTRGLLAKGVEVVMACRNLDKAAAAEAKLKAEFPQGRTRVMPLDTSSLESVRQFTEAFQQQYQRLDLLINNAGIMLVPYSTTVDGLENHFASNYLGHFALTLRLKDLLANTPAARVVTLTSLSYKWAEIDFEDMQATKKYSRRKAYGQSKRADLMFAFELDRRFRAAGVDTLSVAVHPGLAKTNLDQYFLTFLRPLGSLFLQPAEHGAWPVLYAALSPKVQGGDFIGPDGFQQMRGYPTHIEADEYSQRKDIASRLFEESERLAGVGW